MKNILVVFLFAFVGSKLALAETVVCNREQTSCEFDSKDFTIGDNVGIFSEEGDLVARGTVKSMDGRKRKVVITKKFGPIKNGNVVELLDGESSEIRVFKKVALIGVGGDLSLGSVNIGGGTTMIGFEGFGYYRLANEIELVGRFGYTSLDGQVTRTYEAEPTQTVPFTGGFLGFLGGVGYTAFKRRDLSFRGEADIGASYLMAAVNGKPEEVDGAGYKTGVKNGLGFLFKATGSGLYNRGDWHFGINAGLGVLQGNTFWGGGIGIIRDI